ncbi:MAG: DUF2818 family protein [Proteobacteria bacterium]|nr:DUF2818 family protein [Pseudomonadota bacterium]HQR04614.1 DUF2818 family protein [Rhodocyclaceae bacterium]
MTAAQITVIVLAMAAANLPFFSNCILFLLRPASGQKGLGWRLLEVLILYFAVGVLAMTLESRAHGTAYPQRWEFYAITLCLFLVLAYPGFVYRYLWRHH